MNGRTPSLVEHESNGNASNSASEVNVAMLKSQQHVVIRAQDDAKLIEVWFTTAAATHTAAAAAGAMTQPLIEMACIQHVR